jgi:hypothetical protein
MDGRTGDMTHHLQAKAGGNFVIRGCLFIDGVNNQSQGRAPINMCKELNTDLSPNYEWWASSEGNSLFVEKCVFVSHYGRGCVHFFSQASAFAIPTAQMTNVVGQSTPVLIRDNIGMVPTTPTVLSPFSDAKWILNNPVVGAPAWSVSNTVIPYDSTEAAFSNRDIKGYTRAAGAIAASGSVATKRFVWPHGSEARTDAYRGLG